MAVNLAGWWSLLPRDLTDCLDADLNAPILLDSDITIGPIDLSRSWAASARIALALALPSPAPDSPALLLGTFSIREWTRATRDSTSQDLARQRFVSVALGGPDANPGPRAVSLEVAQLSSQPLNKTFSLVSHLLLSNEWKEHFWRLVYNGAPCAARLHLRAADVQPCEACGTDLQDRSHLFYSCSVAQSLITSITDHFTSCGLHPAISKRSLWLMDPPEGYLDRTVWSVVCTLYLSCCAQAGAMLYARSQTAPEAARDPGDDGVDGVAAHIISLFWSRLQTVVLDLSSVPRRSDAMIKAVCSAAKRLPPGGSLPFIRFDPEDPEGPKLWCPI